MNVSKMNLNLLISLDTLLTTCNVTQAAKKMFVTQSAMSNTLKQLRDLFQDELLVMEGRQMQPTSRAQSLHPKIKNLLSQAETIFKPDVFNPATEHRQFTIGMEEYTNFVLLPDLYAYLSQHAPNIAIEIKPATMFDNRPLLESHDIGLAIGLHLTHDSKHIHHDVLFHERLVCIASKHNKLFKNPFTLPDYLNAKHVSITTSHINPLSHIDQLLHAKGHHRQIALTIAHVVPALYTIARSNLIATVPEGIAQEAKRLLDLHIQPCPITVPPILFLQTWHATTHHDSGYQWLRKVIHQLSQRNKE